MFIIFFEIYPKKSGEVGLIPLQDYLLTKLNFLHFIDLDLHLNDSLILEDYLHPQVFFLWIDLLMTDIAGMQLVVGALTFYLGWTFFVGCLGGG